MKRYLLALVAAASMLFASCEVEDYIYLETSMWTMSNAPATYEPTILTFSGRRVTVMNADYIMQPLEDGLWDYYITEQSKELHLYREVADGHGNIVRESHTLEFSMDESERNMRLVYDPLLGSRRIYEFHRTSNSN